ncbi:MAG: Hpt domain-containing protein [Desulfovibrionales bacterium]|nr:MAG: Hpt domain-containing protein [Desulfovibrionales bacterium]
MRSQRERPARSPQCNSLPSQAVDWDDLRKRTMGDNDLAQSLLQMVLDTLPAKMVTFERNLAERNLEGLQGEAHGLKGVALNTGCKALAEIARRMEAAVRSDDLEKIRRLQSELIHESERLRWTIQEQAS